VRLLRLPIWRVGAYLIAAVVVLSAAVYGARQVVRQYQARELNVCVVTDVSFRAQRPDWQYQVKLWMSEVSRAFAPARVSFAITFGGDAYAEEAGGSLHTRRALMDSPPPCRGDLVLGFSGAPGNDVRASATPFGHTLLIATRAVDSDLVIADAITRAVAVGFGLPIQADSLIAIDSPGQELLDSSALALIDSLREYDFAKGVDGLSHGWERRSLEALEAALKSKSRQPAADAHRVLARGYIGGRRYADAVRQLREALSAAPNDREVQLELVDALKRDAQIAAAVEELRHMAAADPSDAKPHAVLADLYRERAQPYLAVEEFQRAIRLDPARADYYVGLADVLVFQVGRLREAGETLDAAQRRSPNNRGVERGLATLGAARRGGEEQRSQALSDLRAHGDSADAYRRLGKAEALLGNDDGAIAAFRKAVTLEPSNGDLQVDIGVLRLCRREYAEAAEALAIARRTGLAVPEDLAQVIARKIDWSYRF
jgi:tetratricopeptide (TPR) repeat protein